MNEKYIIPATLSSKVLSIGPEFKDHRGGIGAVIEVYSHYFEVFNFIGSHKTGSRLFRIYVFSIGFFKFLITLLTKRRIKIIHIHGASYGSFYRKLSYFVIGKYIFRKKIIYHIHGGAFKLFYESSDFFTRFLIKTIFKNSDTIICLSRTWYLYYDQNFKTKKITILPNVIDFPQHTLIYHKTETIVFLFLGLICKAKGVFDLIEVIAKKRGKYFKKMKLLIGGNGETIQLQNLLKKHQLNDLVEFIGWVAKDKKTDVLNKADVYILPSYNEGLPVSILEAMSYGKAIISTNVGGIPEIVKNKENGLLIEPGNLTQLEKAIDFILDHTDQIKRYGARSIQMVQKHLPDSIIRNLSDIYNSVLSDE